MFQIGFEEVSGYLICRAVLTLPYCSDGSQNYKDYCSLYEELASLPCTAPEPTDAKSHARKIFEKGPASFILELSIMGDDVLKELHLKYAAEEGQVASIQDSIVTAAQQERQGASKRESQASRVSQTTTLVNMLYQE